MTLSHADDALTNASHVSNRSTMWLWWYDFSMNTPLTKCSHDLTTRSIPSQRIHGGRTEPRVVCFGMVTPARVLVVDEMPDWNTGAVWTEGAEFVSDDAAIVAGLLAGIGVEVELIGSALGDDDAGRKTVDMLNKMGVRGNFDLRQGIETPFEINVSDSDGGRTYFWNRRPELLATLDDADLSPLHGASMLYVDWYDAPYIERAMRYARQLEVPVFLNIEHGHQDAEVLRSLIPYATICNVRRSLTHPSSVETRSEWRDYLRRADHGTHHLPAAVSTGGALPVREGGRAASRALPPGLLDAGRRRSRRAGVHRLPPALTGSRCGQITPRSSHRPRYPGLGRSRRDGKRCCHSHWGPNSGCCRYLWRGGDILDSLYQQQVERKWI